MKSSKQKLVIQLMDKTKKYKVRVNHWVIYSKGPTEEEYEIAVREYLISPQVQHSILMTNGVYSVISWIPHYLEFVELKEIT